MYINDINILYFLGIGILGLLVGQFVDWCNIRLLEHKKVFSKEFFSVYMKQFKPKYSYMCAMAIIYAGIMYTSTFSLKALAYYMLAPMLISALIIDYKEQIIPNRLNLTIFEVGLAYTFLEGIVNINVAVNMLLGMIVGAGIFLLITFIGGLIAGKEAMGFGDVKLMGALGLFFGWQTIIIISLFAFLMGAIIGVLLIVSKKKSTQDYIPFGPFIVIAAIIAMFVPFNILLLASLKIFTLGTYTGA